MQLPHGAVVALVDGRKFELFRNSGDEAAPELSALPSPSLNTHDPSGAQRAATSHDPTGHHAEEDAHAAAVANWLNHAVEQRKVEKLVVIAAPRTLGALRPHYRKPMQAALIGEVSKDLAGRSSPEIAAALRAR